MEARNCPRCGRVFTYVTRPVCDACYKKEEEQFQSLRVYIDENPTCTLLELADGTGVPQKRILGYIREGRLEIAKGMHGAVRCERCGKPINSGHYCDGCVIEINQAVTELYNPSSENKSRGAKMHIHPKRK